MRKPWLVSRPRKKLGVKIIPLREKEVKKTKKSKKAAKGPEIKYKLKKSRLEESLKKIHTTEFKGPAEEILSEKQEVSESPKAYCTNCSAKVDISNPEKFTTKGGRPGLKGSCYSCRSEVFTRLKD